MTDLTPQGREAKIVPWNGPVVATRDELLTEYQRAQREVFSLTARLREANERLMTLARATRAELDRQRHETDTDEWGETDSRCYLYNAAEAILERDANAAYVSAEAAEQQIDDCLKQADLDA